MARRKRKSRLSPARIAAFAVVIALITAAIWFGYNHLNGQMQMSVADKIAPRPNAGAAPSKIEGVLAASGPARDGQLGVSAKAAVLFRHVEIYQWQEHCDGAVCRYETAWSAPVDSHKFRVIKGHENPASPFNDAIFFAPGLKLGAYAVDPDLLAQQLHASDYAVHNASLPPNLAASFGERDGVLYAGGDPAHPAVGEVRISYRIIAGGVVTLNGVLRGGKLLAH